MDTKFLINLISLIFHFNFILAQPFPTSPCPKIFKYLFDGEIWYGSLELKGQLKIGDPNKLIIILGYSKIIPSDAYLGSLELTESEDDTISHILKEEPIHYELNFPIQRPLPIVMKIVLNGNVICEVARPINGYTVRGHLKLEHTLSTPLSGQKLIASGIRPALIKPLGINDLIDDSILTFNEQNLEKITGPVQCGQIDPHFYAKPLIKGGKTVPRGSWPWLTAIYMNSESLMFICGGNLISDKAVLTAAHCFHGKYSKDDYIIMLGRHDIADWDEKGSIARGIDEVVFYPNYSSDQLTFDADIAVVLLRNVIQFNPYVQPICLPSIHQEITGETGVLVGWGQNQDEEDSTKPKRIELTIVSDVECLRSNAQFRLLTSNRTFCAGNRNGMGPCSGDSGSGLMVKNEGKWTIIGLVSAALSDSNGSSCNLNEFVIYADVRKFLSWIHEILDTE